jgi:hypothetical protein
LLDEIDSVDITNIVALARVVLPFWQEYLLGKSDFKNGLPTLF